MMVAVKGERNSFSYNSEMSGMALYNELEAEAKWVRTLKNKEWILVWGVSFKSWGLFCLFVF